MATTVRSYSKVNLGLAIGPLRPDGFHGLTTLYQTIALHDLVTVSARLLSGGESQIKLRSNHPRVPTDARNTAWRMVEMCLARLGVAAEVTIYIDKRLPIQGGLGAGSANAAASLLGLERELAAAGVAALAPERRLELAAEVGSDVPLFLIGGAVLGLGRGEEVYPMPDGAVGEAGVACVVAVSSVGVSTPQAFRDWDALVSSTAMGGMGLTHESECERLKLLSRVYASLLAQPETQQRKLFNAPEVVNDFERVVFGQQSSLLETKIQLEGGLGDSIYVSLSGSGSALFGLYRSDEDAKAAQHRVQRQPGVQGLITETLPRAAYWRTIYPETSAAIAG